MAGTARPDRGLVFGILGPLQAEYAGTALPLGGPQQRAVLAQLIVAAGSGVTVDQLADMLWGERPPSGYTSTIQTYVFHLRQVLEPDRGRGAPGRVLITENGRYRLAAPDGAPDGALDASVFELATDTGLRQLAAGAFADAAAELHRGLALWRGEVLADLADYDFVAPVAARLSARRLTAVEARIDAELGLGRHAAVIGELDELVARHPLSEQLHRQRILALYRSGRPSEALSAYDGLRHQLADELGVDPSPPLQQLHQQLLTHDSALQWQPMPTTAVTPAAVAAEDGHDSSSPDTITVDAARPRARRRPRLRSRWLVGGAAVLLAAAATTVTTVVLTHQPKSSLPALPADSVGVIDANGSLHDAIPVGQSPDGIDYGFGSLWVTNTGDNTVQRINPRTREVIQTIPVGHSPTALTMGDHHVWVANAGDGTVTEIDAATSRPVNTIGVGALPSAIAAGPTGVWVASSGDDNVQLIDVTRGAVVRTTPVGDGPAGLALDGTTLWVANGRDGTLSHLNAADGTPLSGSISVGSGAKGLAVADGSVWVANQGELSVSRIDVATGRTLATIPVGDGPDAVVAAHGSIWVSDEYDATISQIDPGSNRVVHRHAVGSSPHSLVLQGGNLWVAATDFASASHVGGTLTFSTAAADLGQIDPATVYSPNLGSVERAVYDGLVAFRAAGGVPGVQLVPDLAVAIPRPSDGGRTYTFTIRPHVRYSNGMTVRASDIRRGLFREVTVGSGGGNPSFYTSVVGVPACLTQPSRCDLSAGVQVDDGAGRITFRLSEPDPAFVYKLAMFVFATAPGAPAVATRTPLPTTGPYMIFAYTPDKLIELRRNPYFTQWSYAAQPAGYPDVIRNVQRESAESSVDDVIAGRADVARFVGDARADQLRRYPAQVHEQVFFDTQYITLNIDRAPFSDVRARRALNYALDRRTMVQFFGGPMLARPTCQILPPGFPGHTSFCPYADPAYAPNVELARSLVAASGTEGMRVDVYGPDSARFHYAAQLRYVASVLRQIGYQPVTHLLRTEDDSNIFIGDHRSPVQVSLAPGWIADFPDAASFFDEMFSCSSAREQSANNRNAYGQPDVDQLIARAKAAEIADPPQALDLWNRIDRRIVDDAPVVPTVNRAFTTFVSRRVGNVQTTPLASVLLDQMWVK